MMFGDVSSTRSPGKYKQGIMLPKDFGPIWHNNHTIEAAKYDSETDAAI